MPGRVPNPLSIATHDGELTIDFATRGVTVNGAALGLTPIECDILLCLASSYGMVVPTEDLVVAVWGEWYGQRGHVSVHVHHLRRKLGPFGRLITNKRGVGYSLDPPARHLALPSNWPDDLTVLFQILSEDAVARGVVWLFVERNLSISWVSDSVSDLLGWTPPDMVGREPRDFVVAEDVPAFLLNFPPVRGLRACNSTPGCTTGMARSCRFASRPMCSTRPMDRGWRASANGAVCRSHRALRIARALGTPRSPTGKASVRQAVEHHDRVSRTRVPRGGMPQTLPGPFSVTASDCRLDIDVASRTVRANGVDVPLTPTEFEVLVCLAARTNSVVPLDGLIEAVWGEWFGPRGHVSVHVHHLRPKLGACGGLIVTRRGFGYMLASGTDGAAYPPPPGWGASTFLDVLQADGRARAVIWMVSSADRSVAWVSASVTHLTGWMPHELVGRLPWEFITQSDRSSRVAVDDGVAGDFETPGPVELRCADGSTIWVTASARIFRGPDGRYLGGLTECRPVDPPAAPKSFTLYFDADSTLLAVEPHAPFLGWDPEQVIGSYFSLAGIDPSASKLALDSLVATGQADHRVALAAVTSDGAVSPVMATLRLEIQSGRIVGYSGEVSLD